MIDSDIDAYCKRFGWALDAMSDEEGCLPAENLQKAINRAMGPAMFNSTAANGEIMGPTEEERQEARLRADAQVWANQVSGWHASLAKEALTSPSGNVIVHPSGWVTYRAPMQTWREKLRDFFYFVLLWETPRRTHARHH